MARVYRRLGWEPEILGGAAGVSAGRWRFDDATHDRLCAAAGVSAARSRAWFEDGFPDIAAAGPLPVGG
jgi:acyl homoserine lactone synthase